VTKEEKKIAELKKLLKVSDENRRELWQALQLIREAVEEFAPVGSVKNAEYCKTAMEEAEAIVEGIAKIGQGGFAWSE
jgi:hypothetical protein